MTTFVATPALQAALTKITSLVVTDQEANTVISPTGIWLSLSVLAAGAKGETAVELEALLGINAEELSAITQQVSVAIEQNADLQHLTAIWSNVAVANDFAESQANVEFSNEVNPADIDAWIAGVSDGLSEKFPAHLTDDTVLALADVLQAKRGVATTLRHEAQLNS